MKPVSTDPNAPRTYVAYMRVSTDKQGRTGLGMEAQQAVIDATVRPGVDKLLLPPFVEVESGRKAARPQLAAAIAKCRRTGATLLVAKLDRLSRNVDFLRSLIHGDIDVRFGDLPHIPPGAMGRFLLTQMAAVAELEAGLTSERTKAALAAAKARGVKLGGDRGYRPATAPDGRAGGAASGAARGRAADHAAHRLADTVASIRAELGTQGTPASLRAIAAALTARGVTTPRGGAWDATQVRRMLARLDGAVAGSGEAVA